MAPEVEQTPSPRGDRAKRRWRWGLIFSAVVHLGLLGVLLYVPYTWWVSYSKLASVGKPDDAASEEEATAESSPEAEKEGAPPKKPPAPPIPREALSTNAELLPQGPVGDKLREYVAGVEKLSPERRQQKLNQAAKQLQEISSPEAIDAMTVKFQEWMEVAPRERPKDGVAPAGEFDFQTAQVDDVRRERNDKGKWIYTSVMIDAQGRKIETPIDSATGEELYPIFEQIRQNPLVGQVYRQMVMPMLDKAMKSGKAESPKKALESAVP